MNTLLQTERKSITLNTIYIYWIVHELWAQNQELLFWTAKGIWYIIALDDSVMQSHLIG
jgi:hypothetical protein